MPMCSDGWPFDLTIPSRARQGPVTGPRKQEPGDSAICAIGGGGGGGDCSVARLIVWVLPKQFRRPAKEGFSVPSHGPCANRSPGLRSPNVSRKGRLGRA